MPNVVETADAAGNSSTTYALTVGQTAQGLLTTGSDHDWFAISLQAGVTYTFAMVGTGTNNVGDTFLKLYGGNGITVVAQADDGLPNANSLVKYTPAVSGTYYLDAGSYQNGSAGQYGLSATAGSRASFDTEMGAGVIDTNASWSATPGTGAVVTYGFRASAAPYTVPGSNIGTFTQLSAQQIAAVETALRMFSDVCGVTFQRVNPSGYTNSATMLFGNYFDPNDGAAAFAFLPGSTAANSKDGDIWLNTDSTSTSSLPIGSYDFATVVHEIGHALGLSHPGLYNAGPGVNVSYANDAQFIQDSQQYSMMSYFAGTETGAGDYGTDADTPMLFDVYALQRIYGANLTTRAGDTVYGYNSNAGVLYSFAPSSTPAFCIWDGGGIDTLDCSGFAQSQTIDLREGRFSSVKGIASNISIAIGAVIENAVGGAGNDTIIGNDADNVLSGGLGDDTLSGNLGRDTASYANSTAGVTVSLAVPQGTQQNTIGAGRDSLAGIENLIGSIHGDTLTGDGNANLIDGGGGNDLLIGGGGNDFIDERDIGNFDIDAGAGDDIVSITSDIGGSSSGRLLGGSGKDTLKNNRIDLSQINISGFEVLEATNFIFFVTAAQLDQFDSIIASGSGPSNFLTFWLSGPAGPQVADLSDELNSGGSPRAVSINGSGYDDTLTLGDADDQLGGMFGNDTLDGGLGDDLIQGVDGSDTASYASATAAVTVSLALSGIPQNTGGGGIDRIDSCENLTGSQFADSLTGDGFANTLKGGLANDTLDGGLGNDRLYGEAGDDTYAAVGLGDLVVETLNQGIDTVNATAASYTLTANVERLNFVGTGNFVGRGNSLANTMQGGLGNDLFIADAGGADTFDGRGGTDTMDFRASALGVSVNLTTSVHGGAAAGDVFAGLERFYGSDTATDVMTGGAGNEFFHGFNGNDVMRGLAGADQLYGGNGNDNLDGGDGNDAWLGGDAGADTITGGLGNDRIDGGTENDPLLRGDGGNDTITCGSGDDGAQGGDGDDYIQGQAGRDTIYGGIGNDLITGGDEAGAGDIWLGGDAGIDRAYGGAGNDRIDGGADGDVVLDGGAGDDLITGGDGDDRAFGGAEVDILHGQAGRDALYGGLGNDDLYGGDEVGPGDTWLAGDAGTDYIVGGGGNDRMEGGTENDELWGGLGLDTSNGGAGADYFDYRSVAEGGAGEQIGDWQGGIDTLLIDVSGFGGGLVAGPLAANRLVIGTAATQAFGQFLYNTANGVLYWDINGTGAGGLTFLVKLYTPTFGAPPASLATTDFEIVA